MNILKRCSLPIAWLALLEACAPLPTKLQHELHANRPVEGEVHGAFPDLNLYVFTYRNPKNFFDFVEVSLVAPTAELADTLAALHRHDRVRIQGALMDNRSQQMHVELSSLEVVKKYDATPPLPGYDYQASIPDELRGKDNELFLVHAVTADGAVLVVERRDVVLPVYVRHPELTRNLARNDVVRLFYEIRSKPNRPVHLQLQDIAHPVEVVDSVMALNGKPADVEGPLVLFPKSPQVLFNCRSCRATRSGNSRSSISMIRPCLGQSAASSRPLGMLRAPTPP
jgi:hypothetical protein